jgi:ABC-type lipoprotein export system ATPase subunit
MSAAAALGGVVHVYRTPQGDAVALAGLSLRVEVGEVVVVLGPSGSGKSTLLRILAGLERPTAGACDVLGHDLARLSERRRARLRAQGLGMVDQHHDRALPPDLELREIVALQPALLGAPREEADARAEALLARAGLADRADARPARLSGGERQRVASCAAVAHRPRLLLADEPTGELDAESAGVVLELIRELARETGAAVVLVSHDPASTGIADRVVEIRDGRVAAESGPGSGAPALVLGDGGWVRLPEALRASAGLGARVVAEPHPDGVLLSPTSRGSEPAQQPATPPVPPVGEPGVAAGELLSVGRTFVDGDRERAVLRDVSATFLTGRLSVVTGRSGSGKTTLLRLLAGLERPTAGRVSVLGRDLATLDADGLAALRRSQIGVVPQEPVLVGTLSVAENVALGLELRGLEREEAAARARRWLLRLGLGERLDQRVERLSQGERQRVAVARAVAPAPALLLLDEPTSRLDQAAAADLGGLLAELAHAGGMAVVCATHEPLVAEAADAELALGARLTASRTGPRSKPGTRPA